MYILCLYKKDRIRGDFGILQSGPKGVILKIGVVDWSQVYVYILSMGRGGVRVMNTWGFFVHDNAPSMDRNWRGSSPRTIRHRAARNRYRPDSTGPFNLLGQSSSPGTYTHPSHPRPSSSSYHTTYTPVSTGGGIEDHQCSSPRVVTCQRIILRLDLLIMYSWLSIWLT